MKLRGILLLILCFTVQRFDSRAEEFKKGPAYPKDLRSRADLPLSSFIDQRRSTTDRSVVVLLRGEQHYILNDKANRELLEKPCMQDDLIILDDDATAFLGWRRQHPETKLNSFLEANPELVGQALRYDSESPDFRSSSKEGESLNGRSPGDAGSRQSRPTTVNLPRVDESKSAESGGHARHAPVAMVMWGSMVIVILGIVWLLLRMRK